MPVLFCCTARGAASTVVQVCGITSWLVVDMQAMAGRYVASVHVQTGIKHALNLHVLLEAAHIARFA
jgi:hypothetical protein